MLNKEITQKSYQLTALEFARNVINLAPTESIKKFFNYLPPKPKILDLGCGSGRDAKIFTENSAHVLGIDFCSNMLDIAKKHAPLAAFQLMDIEEITLPKCSFDGVWAACSLGHISKQHLPDVLMKISFILKQEGYFYLTFKKGLGEGLQQDTRYNGEIMKFWSYYEADELTELLKPTDFKILELSIVKRTDPYQTHDGIRVFCQKRS